MSNKLDDITIPAKPDFTVFVYRGFEFRATKDWIRGLYQFRFRRYSKKKRKWFKEWRNVTHPELVEDMGLKKFTNWLIDDRIKQTKQT